MKTIDNITKEFNEQFISNGEFIKGAWGTMPSEVEFFIEQQIKELLDDMPIEKYNLVGDYDTAAHDELCDELKEWRNKVLGDDIQTMADKAAQAVREDLKKYDN